MEKKDFVLASSSPQRIALLRQIGYEPKDIMPADIDESCLPNEMPLPFVRRMALNKALCIKEKQPDENVLACDTIVVAGRRILHKSPDEAAQKKVMEQLSGKNHKVISSVCLINKKGKISQRTVTTKITMKKLSKQEIEDYVAGGEWRGVCGYKIEGCLAGYVKKIVGSYSGVVGLPLYETLNLLKGENIR